MSFSPAQAVGDPGKDHGLATRFAEAGVAGERGADVHEVADGVADDRVSAMDRPGKPVPGSTRHDDVFELVVEILLRQSWCVFSERRGRRDPPVVFERTQVVLGPRDDTNMGKSALWLERSQNVAEHLAIEKNILIFASA